jgi:hypothetical protein
MKIKYAVVALLMSSVICAEPLGFLEPYNFMVESEPMLRNNKLQWNFLAQASYDVQAFNEQGDQVNALQVYEDQQNIFALYQGLETESQFMQLVNGIAGGPGGGGYNTQDGLFTPTGKFEGQQVAFLASYQFHNHCFFKVALPVYKVKLYDVDWSYTGSNETFSGQAVESLLVQNFIQDTYDNFDLSLTGWKRAGLGDLACLLDYIADYPQGRSLLRNVRVHFRLGLTFPTGLLGDENKLMAIPFGSDGSVTLPFGGGLDINLARYLQCGFRGQFNYIWGNSKERRIRTFQEQTTLLYPTTISAFKNYGMIQRFDLYVQLYNFVSGISCKCAYEYFKKGQDTISINQVGLNAEVFNLDRSLEEVTLHNMITTISFDSAFLKKYDTIHPQVSLFWNVPFNGSFGIGASTIGAQLALDF